MVAQVQQKFAQVCIINVHVTTYTIFNLMNDITNINCVAWIAPESLFVAELQVKQVVADRNSRIAQLQRGC